MKLVAVSLWQLPDRHPVQVRRGDTRNLTAPSQFAEPSSVFPDEGGSLGLHIAPGVAAGLVRQAQAWLERRVHAVRVSNLCASLFAQLLGYDHSFQAKRVRMWDLLSLARHHHRLHCQIEFSCTRPLRKSSRAQPIHPPARTSDFARAHSRVATTSLSWATLRAYVSLPAALLGREGVSLLVRRNVAIGRAITIRS